MARQKIRFGVIGCGLMGREFASAAARWCHLLDQTVEPEIVAACDPSPAATAWFADYVPSARLITADYRRLLDDPSIDALYIAVPHNLHASVYADAIRAGKHVLGEKPFGIDAAANAQISAVLAANPKVLARCSSEFPFYPGAHAIAAFAAEGRFGKIIEVEAGFWHSSDFNPTKPMNWKRRIATNGAYGCMGDLGMHVVHLPLRFGWKPKTVRALLSRVYDRRPDTQGNPADCETWDNAILACDVETSDQTFPMVLSMKRIAPGHANTWFIRIIGTELSAEFSTRNPKQLATLPYAPGDEQAWHITDVANRSAYASISGPIFEFGFSDSILQMWAAFCDELAHGGVGMSQPFHCATPVEAASSHDIFTAALSSHAEQIVSRPM